MKQASRPFPASRICLHLPPFCHHFTQIHTNSTHFSPIFTTFSPLSPNLPKIPHIYPHVPHIFTHFHPISRIFHAFTFTTFHTFTPLFPTFPHFSPFHPFSHWVAKTPRSQSPCRTSAGRHTPDQMRGSTRHRCLDLRLSCIRDSKLTPFRCIAHSARVDPPCSHVRAYSLAASAHVAYPAAQYRPPRVSACGCAHRSANCQYLPIRRAGARQPH